MKKKSLILVAIALLAISGTALAAGIDATRPMQKLTPEERHTAQLDRKEIHDAIRTDRQVVAEQKKEETQAERCERIQERVTERAGKVDDVKEKHMAVYANMVNRISKFTEKLGGQGYDVSKIEADIVVLNEKIQNFSTDYSAQATTLGETKQYACDRSDGEFRSKLVEARTMAETVRADALEIRKYVQETVLVDIKALREQKTETQQ